MTAPDDRFTAMAQELCDFHYNTIMGECVEDIATALRRAAEEDREACAKEVLWHSQVYLGSDDVHLAVCRKINAALSGAAKAIRAHAVPKSDTPSVPPPSSPAAGTSQHATTRETTEADPEARQCTEGVPEGQDGAGAGGGQARDGGTREGGPTSAEGLSEAQIAAMERTAHEHERSVVGLFGYTNAVVCLQDVRALADECRRRGELANAWRLTCKSTARARDAHAEERDAARAEVARLREANEKHYKAFVHAKGEAQDLGAALARAVDAIKSAEFVLRQEAEIGQQDKDRRRFESLNTMAEQLRGVLAEHDRGQR